MLQSRLLITAAVILAWALPSHMARSQRPPQQSSDLPDTSFTYRGQLLRLGEPVTDLVDFELTLWGGAEDGNRIGQPQWIIGQYVMDGLFSLTLDFGPEAFSGTEPRWLEITVLSSADTEPVTLTPRQRIAATPVALYALKSPVAETHTQGDDGGAVGAIGARSDSGAQGNTTGAPGPKGRDGLDGDGVTGRVGDDQQQNPQGSWVSNGNDIYYIAGNVGIGTSTPGNPLQTENASPNGTAIVGWARSSGSNLGVYGLANGATGTGVFGLAKSASDSASFGGRFESRSSIGRGVYAIASSNGSGQSFGGWFQSNSSKGRGIQGYVSSATGKTYGGIFQSNSNQGYGVYGLAANAGDSVTFGGNFRSKSTKGYGVFGIADATSGTTYGVFGRSNSPTGHGVYGYGGAATGNAYGVVGETRSVAGTGVYGLAYSDTGDTYGGYFVSHSTGGVGVYGYTDSSTGGTNGVMGVADSEYGTGVYGLASNVNGSQYGGFFQTNGSSGAALVGYASSTTGGAQAVRAECFSPSSTTLYTAANSDTGTPKAIYAWCAADYGYAGYFAGGRNYFGGNTGFGTNQAPLYSVDVGGLMRVSAPNSSPEGQVAIRGVTQIDGALCIYGLAAGESGTRTGIYGVTDATSGNYGVLSNGNSGATGVKSFHIDHPLDPENQFLDHFSAEGPEPYLMYRGNAMLDENGETWVQLPDYFEAINRDYHYQLTSIGAPGPNLYIADKIRNNRFRIAGGTPGAEVSWTVTGVRDDPWVQTHPTSDEYSKPQNQRGKYLRPDLYGRPQSDEIYHVPR